MQVDYAKIIKLINEDEEKFLALRSKCLKNRKFLDYYQDSFATFEDAFEKGKNISYVKTRFNVKNLKKVIAIYNSGKSEYQKVLEINKIYPSANDLLIEFHNFIIPFYDREEIQTLIKAYTFYAKAIENGVIDNINYVINNEKYLTCLPYAKFIISEYLKYDEILDPYYFYDKYGISSNTFDFLVNAVKEFDYDLYKSFELKQKANHQKLTKYILDSIDKITMAIMTGKLEKSDFKVLDFWLLFPFKNKGTITDMIKIFETEMQVFIKNKTFPFVLNNIVNIYFPERISSLIEYLNKNEIAHSTALDQASDYFKKDILTTLLKVNDRVISDEEKMKIIIYIRQNQLPLSAKLFSVVLKEYLKNEDILKDISIQDFDDKKYTLICKK